MPHTEDVTQESAAIDLEDRVAVVTGAGRGIGRATALMLAASGARVVVNDLGTGLRGEGASRDPANAVAEEIRDRGGRAEASHASVAEWSGAERIVAWAHEAFGGLDLLVNNAGLSADAPIWELDPELFDRVVRSHLHGGFHCLRAAAPHMKAQGFGRVVNLVSRAGLIGVPGNPAYGAAKGGLFGLTNVAARDLAPHGVTVNAVNPAATETRMVTTALESLARGADEERARAAALARALQPPERVAAVITALCSPAAGAINGQVVYLERERIGFFHPLHLARAAPLHDADAAGSLGALASLEPFGLDAVYGA